MRSFKDEDEALGFLRLIHWGNAAGSCRQAEFAVRCAQSGMSMVTYGTTTFDSRIGNTGGDFYYDEATRDSVNALGMPNRGHEAEMLILPGLRKQLNAAGASLNASISTGDKYVPEEIEMMSADIVRLEAADSIEWNSSCPNVEVNGQRKPPVSYCPEDFEVGVRALSKGAKNLPYGVKISPTDDINLLYQLVGICIRYDVNWIVCSNTIPNQIMYRSDGAYALPGMIRGGRAGQCLIPRVGWMIRELVPKLKGTNTRIIAAGGIEAGEDAYAYLCMGLGMVVGFQFNTALARRGEDLRFVGDLIVGKGDQLGLIDLMTRHGLSW